MSGETFKIGCVGGAITERTNTGVSKQWIGATVKCRGSQRYSGRAPIERRRRLKIGADDGAGKRASGRAGRQRRLLQLSPSPVYVMRRRIRGNALFELLDLPFDELNRCA